MFHSQIRMKNRSQAPGFTYTPQKSYIEREAQRLLQKFRHGSSCGQTSIQSPVTHGHSEFNGEQVITRDAWQMPQSESSKGTSNPLVFTYLSATLIASNIENTPLQPFGHLKPVEPVSLRNATQTAVITQPSTGNT